MGRNTSLGVGASSIKPNCMSSSKSGRSKCTMFIAGGDSPVAAANAIDSNCGNGTGVVISGVSARPLWPTFISGVRPDLSLPDDEPWELLTGIGPLIKPFLIWAISINSSSVNFSVDPNFSCKLFIVSTIDGAGLLETWVALKMSDARARSGGESTSSSSVIIWPFTVAWLNCSREFAIRASNAGWCAVRPPGP